MRRPRHTSSSVFPVPPSAPPAPSPLQPLHRILARMSHSPVPAASDRTGPQWRDWVRTYSPPQSR